MAHVIKKYLGHLSGKTERAAKTVVEQRKKSHQGNFPKGQGWGDVIKQREALIADIKKNPSRYLTQRGTLRGKLADGTQRVGKRLRARVGPTPGALDRIQSDTTRLRGKVQKGKDRITHAEDVAGKAGLNKHYARAGTGLAAAAAVSAYPKKRKTSTKYTRYSAEHDHLIELESKLDESFEFHLKGHEHHKPSKLLRGVRDMRRRGLGSDGKPLAKRKKLPRAFIFKGKSPSTPREKELYDRGKKLGVL